MTLEATPTAGWYHDPVDSSAWRWWDGGTWTDHVRSKTPQPTPQPSTPQSTFTAAPAAPRYDAQAYASADSGYKTERYSGPAWHATVLRSPQTPGVWLLAFSPLLTVVFAVAAAFAIIYLALPELPNVAYSVISIIPLWLMAALDRKALKNRGYDAPNLAWMLLVPPLAYLIARGRAVRREGQRAWPAELVFFVNLLIVGAVLFGLILLSGVAAELQQQLPV